MKKTEQGQALVLIALAFVVMLGFVALAIDGGMIYADRRFEQNAADAASLAGGGAGALTLENNHIYYDEFNCKNSNVYVKQAIIAALDAAVSRAADNNFSIQKHSPILNQNGVEAICNDNFDKYIDIHVMITKDTNSIFAHFVYNGPWRNTVDSVTRFRPRTAIAFGNAIVALNDDLCSGNSNGVIFGGSAEMKVNGNGVFSNGCLKGNGSQFTTTVTGGDVNYVSEEAGTTSAISPAPQQVPSTLPSSSYMLDNPDCSSLSNKTQHGNTIGPGIYSTISLTSGDLTLNPGLYCITSSSTNALKVTGGNFDAEGVTFYVENGGVNMSANAVITATAPLRDPDPSPAVPGMLIQLPVGNTNVVSVQGTSASTFIGTIYAPSGYIHLAGTSDSGSGGTDVAKFYTQLIGYDVMVTGNGYLDINYDETQQATIPARLELSK